MEIGTFKSVSIMYIAISSANILTQHTEYHWCREQKIRALVLNPVALHRVGLRPEWVKYGEIWKTFGVEGVVVVVVVVVVISSSNFISIKGLSSWLYRNITEAI